MLVSLPGFGLQGFVGDRAPFALPAEALTAVRNGRILDGSIAPRKGEVPAFGNTVTDPPLYLLPFQDFNGHARLLVPTASKIYDFLGKTKTDVTRVSGTYNAGKILRWNGGVLNGIPVLNNAADIPQAWAIPGTGQFVDLPTWPSTYRARVIRPFKSFLVALGITKGTDNFPYLVKWSDAADPGALPGSWDETDPTNLAGETPLAEDSGTILDGVPLRDVMVLYKQNSVWAMQFTGDLFVFSFRKLFNDFGLLSHDCVTEFAGKHFVVTNEDFIIHDGNSWKSVADGKVKRWFFRHLNNGFAYKTFVCQNFFKKEIMVCFAMDDSEVPNMALVYNWGDDTWIPQEIPDLAYATSGLVPADALLSAGAQYEWVATGNEWADEVPTGSDSGYAYIWGTLDLDTFEQVPFYDFLDEVDSEGLVSSGERWDPSTHTWAGEGTEPWDGSEAFATRRIMIGARYDNYTSLLLMDTGRRSLGVPIETVIERTHLQIGGGQGGPTLVPAQQLGSNYVIKAIYPHFLATPTEAVEIYLAQQTDLGQEPKWAGPFVVDPKNNFKVNCLVNTRVIGIRLRSTSANRWRLAGITLDVSIGSRF